MNRKTLRKIAKNHGVTAKEVKQDMQAAINATYQTPNLIHKTAQDAVPRKGEIPTVAEFVDYVAKEVKQKEVHHEKAENPT